MVRTRVEVQEQTEVGDALVRGLVRAQLGLALRLAAVVVVLGRSQSRCWYAFPELRGTHRARYPAELAAARRAAYPLLYVVGPAVRAAGRAGASATSSAWSTTRTVTGIVR